jgi:hypothetical protein
MTTTAFAAVVRAGHWWRSIMAETTRREAWQRAKARQREAQRRERRARVDQLVAKAASDPTVKRLFRGRVGADLGELPGFRPVPSPLEQRYLELKALMAQVKRRRGDGH